MVQVCEWRLDQDELMLAIVRTDMPDGAILGPADSKLRSFYLQLAS